MHRLHVKIFLWFWLAVLVVSGTLVSLTELSHSRADDDRAWEMKYAPRLNMWARQESQILRRDGPAGLERYIGSFEMRTVARLSAASLRFWRLRACSASSWRATSRRRSIGCALRRGRSRTSISTRAWTPA